MSYSVQNIRNVCLLGHSGSGKTSLAESLLFMTGAIDRMGRVADGNTVCDYDPEEVKRQISLSTAVAPIDYKGCRINVLDTPGAFDFSGEVMEALRAADAAIIVASAKDGVSVGVEKAWKYCEERNMPRFIYISKIDEDHSDYNATFDALRERFGNKIAPVVVPTLDENKKVTGLMDILNKRAYEMQDGKRVEIELPEDKVAVINEFNDALKESVAETSEEFMERFFNGEDFTYAEMAQGLRQGVRELSVFPVLCGSAVADMGTLMLLDNIMELLPSPENCIGCNKCALVCPHAAIRPFLLNAEEEAAKPAAFVTKEAKGKGFEGLTFRMQVDPLDCQGCGACANVCPAKEKALVMELLDTQMPEQENWEHALTLSTKTNPMDKFTVRGSQFERPLYEFSGACAGCGEAPYMKLMSQLFGDRMFVTSATGCAYVVGSSTPSFPYVANEKGHGPANSNSLFEDNAEYALGMKLSIDQMRRQMAAHAEAVVASTSDAALKSALEAWLAEGDNGDKTRALSEAVVAALDATAETSDDIAFLKANKDALPKKSVWMYGGDGWAYDIGFGGLDHVLASGADVNVLVVDTEVYSNTGGQASKATQLGAVAQFANGGKRTGKKDLGAIAMTYGNVYVAQVAMGANEQHLITALKEAEAHHGPSILIAYAPCINHGISKGMSQAQLEEKLASECGYWPLWRYVPELKAEGKNPFILTSKEPNGQLLDFMMGETRFASLTRTFPETAKVLFAEAEEFCAQRYAKYKHLAEQ